MADLNALAGFIESARQWNGSAQTHAGTGAALLGTRSALIENGRELGLKARDLGQMLPLSAMTEIKVVPMAPNGESDDVDLEIPAALRRK